MSGRVDYDVEAELLMAGWLPVAVIGRVTKTTTTRDGNSTTTTEEVVDTFRHPVAPEVRTDR